MVKEAQLKSKSQASGTLSPCRRRLILWIMNSSPTGSMLPTTEAARCFSTMTPSTLTSMSRPFTSMIPGASDGRRPVMVLQGWLSRAVLSLHTSHIQRAIAQKLTLTVRAVMISQQIDVVTGDFNGIAWRCSSRNNISTIEDAFADFALPTPLGPTLLKPPESVRYWKVRLHGALSIPHEAPCLRPTDQSCHHKTLLHLDFVEARRSVTTRKVQSKDPLKRTSCAVPLRPAEKAHQRYHERPFALFVTLRPFARVQQC